MSDIALTLRTVTKRMDGREVLSGASAEFTRGELVIVRPWSGPGRGLVARLLVGQVYPDEGVIERCGPAAPPPGSAWGFLRAAPVHRSLKLRAAAYGLAFGPYEDAVGELMDDPAALARPFERLQGRDRAIVTFAASWLLPCPVFAFEGGPFPKDAIARERLMPLWRSARRSAAIIWIARPGAMPRGVSPGRIAELKGGRLLFTRAVAGVAGAALRGEGSP